MVERFRPRWRIIINIKYGKELEDGTYEFQGKLEGPELQFIVEVGIQFLMMKGALPLKSVISDHEKATTITEMSKEIQ